MDIKQNIHNGRVSDASKISNYRKLEEDILYNNHIKYLIFLYLEIYFCRLYFQYNQIYEVYILA